MKLFKILILVSFILSSCRFFGDDFVEPKSTYKESVTINDFLYQVEADFLSTFDISAPNNINLVDEKRLNSRIESLVTFGEVLFISSGGSLIAFKINNSGIPEEDNKVSLNMFSNQQTECDPVIIKDNIAYVALADYSGSSNACQRFESNNELRIYNIETFVSPTLLSLTQLSDIKDIATYNDLLFVSDGSNGFKIFDKSELTELIELYHFSETPTKDVIVNNDMLLVVGLTELIQYDFSDISNVREVSKIEL